MPCDPGDLVAGALVLIDDHLTTDGWRQVSPQPTWPGGTPLVILSGPTNFELPGSPDLLAEIPVLTPNGPRLIEIMLDHADEDVLIWLSTCVSTVEGSR